MVLSALLPEFWKAVHFLNHEKHENNEDNQVKGIPHKHSSGKEWELENSSRAAAADIGERECLRCFQRFIQISPLQYLLKYRVAQAASLLLRNQNYSVSEICRCGFESPSNFSQMFKRYFKTTPREYNKRA